MQLPIKGNIYHGQNFDSNIAFPWQRREETTMVLYHRGAAIQASVTKRGCAFIARAVILEEDGEATSLGVLGEFASPNCAYEFALRSATAFVDGEPMPRPPFAPLSTM
jgi:hypothetical protein